MLSLAELEAAIVADPDDVEIRRVYCDALQEQANPRGEHLAAAFLADTGDEVAAVRVRTLQRAAAERITKRLNKDYVVRLSWTGGFVEHVDIDGRSPADKFPRAKLRELIEQPELVGLRSLDLRGIWNAEWKLDRMLKSLPELVEGRAIRFLGIGDGEIEEEHIAGLRKALPRLDGLGVLTSKPTSALRAMPGLRDVELASRKLGSEKLVTRVISGLVDPLRGPPLERLVLHGMGKAIRVEAFETILSGVAFPKLKHLGVFGQHQLTTDLWRQIIDCKLLAQLESFGFCAADIWDDDETERWLRDNGDKLEDVALFTSALWPDDDNGHDSGRLGLIFKALSRSAEAVPEIEHHLQFSGEDEDHYGCWEELGEAMVWAGRAEEALVPLARAIELFDNEVSDESIFSYRTQAETLDSLERYEEALAVLDRTLEHEANNSWTHRSKGRALRELERYEEALPVFERAIETALAEARDDRPEILGWGYVELGRTLWQMRRIDDALAAFENARTQGEETASRAAWWAESAIENQRGNHAKAHSCLVKATELVLGDDQESPLYELGEVLFLLGDHAKALEVWRNAATEHASWRDVDEQGFTLLALGKPAEALAVVDSARAERGGGRACALHALGRTDEAIAALADYGHRIGLTEPVCAYRHVVGPLLQGCLHRAAGREAEAHVLFEQARRSQREPRELHAALIKELGPAKDCHRDLCGRGAAVTAIAASLALGDRNDAAGRARELGVAVDAGSARLMPMRMWELHAALPLLGADATIAETALRVVELCRSGLAITGGVTGR